MYQFVSKNLPTGYELGLHNGDYYIPIPSTLWEHGAVEARHVDDKIFRRFTTEDIAATKYGFPNKNKVKATDPDTYDLYCCHYRNGEPPLKAVVDLKPV
jgi:hypothetical protein